MRSSRFPRSILLLLSLALLVAWSPCTVFSAEGGGSKLYAVVVSRSTMEEPGWLRVLNALKAKYNARVVVYRRSVWEARAELSSMAPDYVCFLAKPTEACPSFVREVNRLMRQLDEDPYGDAVYAILTGYTYEDALRIVCQTGFRVKRVLSGSSAGWLEYVPEGLASSETDYGRVWVKHLNGTIVEVKGPTDRTGFLIHLLNTGRFDMFITSGHAEHDRWQLHYPDPGLEGFFRSRGGVVYGEARNGSVYRLNSTNPKIYFGLGNCYIGAIRSMDSMPPAWIHSGGAVFYTGYVIPEGPHSYQLGGIPAYFMVQDRYTWAEAFYVNNQALIFDMTHETPGPNREYLREDVDGAALYGEPALNVRVEPTVEPLYSKGVEVRSLGGGLYEVKVWVRMNRDGTPGWNGKWGNRHPVILLPMRFENMTVVETNAYEALVTDNFALLYVWRLGDKPLKAGEERYVVFRANLMKRPRRPIEEAKPLIPIELQVYLTVLAVLTVIGRFRKRIQNVFKRAFRRKGGIT